MQNPLSQRQRSWWQALVVRFAYSRVGRWFGSRFMHLLDGLFHRASGGRHTLSRLTTGEMIGMLITTGRNSGQPRSIPVMFIADGDSLLVIASNWGQKGHPSWYLNLKKNPHAEISLPTMRGKDMVMQRIRVVARELEGQEREDAWQLAASVYPGYAVYQEKAKSRKIPVLRLEEEG